MKKNSKTFRKRQLRRSNKEDDSDESSWSRGSKARRYNPDPPSDDNWTTSDDDPRESPSQKDEGRWGTQPGAAVRPGQHAKPLRPERLRAARAGPCTREWRWPRRSWHIQERKRRWRETKEIEIDQRHTRVIDNRARHRAQKYAKAYLNSFGYCANPSLLTWQNLEA